MPANSTISAAPASPANSLAETKGRLLEAAGEHFAKDGFAKATVRDICRTAGANVAAVNYHYQDKHGLYRAVFEYACVCAKPAPEMRNPAMPLTRRLHAFVHAFLSQLLDEGRPAWAGKLMAREMAEPTGALDHLVEHHVRPNFLHLAGMVREVLGRQVPIDIVRRCVGSIISQCLFYHHSRPVITRLHPDLRLDRDEIAAIANHITGFALGGLRALAAARRAPRLRTKPRTAKATR